MEIWDAYNADGTKAGVDLVRGEPVPEGLYHLVSEILVRHRDGDYLLMQRSFEKPNYPGCWEASAGGSALKGEDALQCAIRETMEETGLHGRMEKILPPYFHRDTVYQTFLCMTDCDKNSVVLQQGETEAYRWLNESAFICFLSSDEVIPAQKVRLTPWLRKMGYLED